mmetsp:Transcript_22328/g.68884  ORF Transcript_22328/g.68884 Transcript_22328/m.68884 type:complete len:204 (+) Transcript_22328:173-784(+)
MSLFLITLILQWHLGISRKANVWIRFRFRGLRLLARVARCLHGGGHVHPRVLGRVQPDGAPVEVRAAAGLGGEEAVAQHGAEGHGHLRLRGRVEHEVDVLGAELERETAGLVVALGNALAVALIDDAVKDGLREHVLGRHAVQAVRLGESERLGEGLDGARDEEVAAELEHVARAGVLPEDVACRRRGGQHLRVAVRVALRCA